jgi:hypothetical protein
MRREFHFDVYLNTQMQLEEDPVLSSLITVIRDKDLKTKRPFTQTEVRKILNSRDTTSIWTFNIVNDPQYNYHVDKMIKYRPSSIGMGKGNQMK